MPEETTAQTQERHQPHPRGQKTKGSCAYLECTEEATKGRRVAAGKAGFVRLVVEVCDLHADAIDQGAPIFVEFTKA